MTNENAKNQHDEKDSFHDGKIMISGQSHCGMDSNNYLPKLSGQNNFSIFFENSKYMG